MIKPVRLCALAKAQSFVGVKEEPLGSNTGVLVNKWLRGAGVSPPNPWCMAFLHSACFKPCGVDLGGGASVGNFRDWAKAHGTLVEHPERPFKGDIVCFEWEQDDWPDHVGIVEKVLALRWLGGQFVGWVQSIEGNSNDRVSRNRRWIRPSYQFVRIPDPKGR